MYEKIINYLKRLYPQRYIPRDELYDLIYIFSLYVKYLCENNVYKYEDINNDNIKEYCDLIDTRLYHRIDFSTFEKYNYKPLNIEHIINIFRFTPLHELVAEFFYYHKDIGINILDKEVLKLCYMDGCNISNYDRDGSTIYVDNNHLYQFKMLDKILGIENHYIAKPKVDSYITRLVKYIYVDHRRVLSPMHPTVDDQLKEYFQMKNRYRKPLIIKIDYKYVSKLGATFRRYSLQKVILSKNSPSTILWYNGSPLRTDNLEPISLIQYDDTKIDLDRLKAIIDKNIENPDNLIKIGERDLAENNNRIGFKLYSNKDTQENIKDITSLVDENSRLVKRIQSLDIIIQTEIDNLTIK